MDTKFWGPSGWRLLHSIVSGYNHNTSSKQKYLHFFENLPYILPCIYCRQSLAQYYQECPIQLSDLDNSTALHYWLYRIHNLVNAKLRDQGLLDVADPTFSEVVAKFKGSESYTCLQGWDFLYSIAMNYPAQSNIITEHKRQIYRIFFDTFLNLIFFS